jgi:FixJ family two-component response regulator
MTDVASVFVVDDDHSVRRSLARLLEAAGYRAEGFGSAADFLEQLPCCDLSSPACALVDVRMPEISWFDLFQQLRRRCPDLPVIFITGHGDTAMAERASRAGVSGFLVKPVDESLLVAAVEEALAASRLRLSLDQGR